MVFITFIHFPYFRPIYCNWPDLHTFYRIVIVFHMLLKTHTYASACTHRLKDRDISGRERCEKWESLGGWIEWESETYEWERGERRSDRGERSGSVRGREGKLWRG